MNGSEVGWGRPLKQEGRLCRRELLITVPHADSVFSPVAAGSHLLPNHRGPDVVNICLLHQAFTERGGTKQGGRITCWKLWFPYLLLLPRPTVLPWEEGPLLTLLWAPSVLPNPVSGFREYWLA